MTVNLRKMYVDCRYGQLHLLTGFPSGGGFGERAALVCLHDSGRSGADFRCVAESLGNDRSVYAPDAPGAGQSDSPARRPTAKALAAAVGDLLDQLRLREVDLLGCGVGADVAIELATSRASQVRRVVIHGRPKPAVELRQSLLELQENPAVESFKPGQAAELRAFLDRD